MNLKNKLEKWFLTRSNSYNFYKDQYEKYIKNSENPDVEKEFIEIKKEFDSFKRNTNEQMDAIVYLMRTLFIDYELNNPKNALKYIQDLSRELLLLVAEVCDENNISWWLDKSTLLGAVRHGNFIPWDDEVDIGMMRKDSMEFKRIFHSVIQNNNLEDIIEFDENNYSMRISVKNNDNGMVLGILKISIYDFIKDYNKKTIKKQYNSIDLNDDFEEYCKKLGLSLDQCDYIVAGAGNKSDNFYILKTDKLLPLDKISFGENSYYCPGDNHYYLKKMYGDYLNLPNIISIPENTDKFRYNENNEEIFSETINRLKRR